MFIPGWKGLHKQRGVQSWITLLLKLSWILHKKISICWCWDVLGGGFQSPSHDSMEGSNLATCFVWQHIPGQNMSNWSKATLPDAVGWCQLYICSACLRRHGYFQKKHVRSPDYQDYFKKIASGWKNSNTILAYVSWVSVCFPLLFLSWFLSVLQEIMLHLRKLPPQSTALSLLC